MVKVEKLVPGGQALGTHSDGRKIFFWNALPGELVENFEITKRKAHYYEATATKIAEPSPQRVQPADACYLATSPWQILAYPYELAQKRELVREIFREHGIAVEPPEVQTDGRAYHYRNKMEYALYWDNATAKIELAFHMRGSHRKFPVSQSSLEQPEIWTAAQQILAELNQRHEAARNYQSLLLRADQHGQVAGGLYENGQPHPVFAPLADQLLGYTYHYSPNGFFQINLPMYERALALIQAEVSTPRVLDLYSGVGTIGLSVARDRELTLVEADKFAYGELVKNLPQNGAVTKQPNQVSVKTATGTLTACLTKAEQALDFITPDATVILDPPRAGCAPALIRRLTEVQPPVIIYLSCNPATQARDLEALLKSYQITKLQPYNFFPRTPHIENLVVLKRQ